MNTLLKIIIAVAGIIILALIVSSASKNTSPVEEIPEEIIQEEEPLVEETFTTVQIPLASMAESGDFGPFGCNAYLNFHEIEVPQTTGVLGAVYEQLFSLPYEAIPGVDDKNIIASHENLDFDYVEISDGDALVYLTGTVMGNHCADEVFRHQIEQSAFQFDTVDSITVFVNNEIFDWCDISDADASESGCDINPKLWIKQKD
jgi:hypothetical protein